MSCSRQGRVLPPHVPSVRPTPSPLTRAFDSAFLAFLAFGALLFPMLVACAPALVPARETQPAHGPSAVPARALRDTRPALRPVSASLGSAGDELELPGYYVEGPRLFDRCDEPVVLRGVNKMQVYWDVAGRAYAEIAKTGANAVRIMWTGDPSVPASALAANLQAALDAQLIPVLGNWDATGDFEKMDQIERWWTSDEIAAVMRHFAPHVILDIANEAGAEVADTTWFATYRRIVQHMRRVDIHALLAVDAAGHGRNVEQLLRLAPGLLAADPDHNLLFDWHEYDGGRNERARISWAFEKAQKEGIALIVGEFASAGAGQCGLPVPYTFLLKEAQRVGVGTFAWSWDNFNDDCRDETGQSVFDMVSNPFDYRTLRPGWATEVCSSDENSIRATAIKPTSLRTGHCADSVEAAQTTSLGSAVHVPSLQ